MSSIAELQELIAAGRELGFRGAELRAWVEAECSKLRSQQEAERAAVMAELAAQRVELERQYEELRAREASAGILNGHLQNTGNTGQESTKKSLVPLAPIPISEPCTPLSNDDTLRLQIMGEDAAAEGAATIPLDLSGPDIDQRSAGVPHGHKTVTIPQPGKYQLRHRKIRKRKKPSQAEGKVTNVAGKQHHGRKPVQKFRPLYFSRLKSVRLEHRAKKLRVISAIKPVTACVKPDKLRIGQAFVSRRSTSHSRWCSHTLRANRKRWNSPAADSSFCKPEYNTWRIRKPNRTRLLNYEFRKSFHGQHCWKYRRKKK